MNLIVRPEQPEDSQSISALHRQAFHGPAESDLVAALRQGGYARLSLVAEHDGQIVGHILFSRLPILRSGTGESIEALSLAPMAILPEYQHQGIGSQLLSESLRLCRLQGHQIILVLGHPHFYRRFGFSSALAEPLQSPFSGEHWMALELTPNALAGVAGRVEFPPPFHAVGG